MNKYLQGIWQFMLTNTFSSFLLLILCAQTIDAHLTDDKTEIQD